MTEPDSEVLWVTGIAATREVRRHLELEWFSGDRRGVVRIDDNGRPFRTSGAKGRPLYDYPLGGTTWEPGQPG